MGLRVHHVAQGLYGFSISGGGGGNRAPKMRGGGGRTQLARPLISGYEVWRQRRDNFIDTLITKFQFSFVAEWRVRVTSGAGELVSVRFCRGCQLSPLFFLGGGLAKGLYRPPSPLVESPPAQAACSARTRRGGTCTAGAPQIRQPQAGGAHHAGIAGTSLRHA